jgi:hypothetical protein
LSTKTVVLNFDQSSEVYKHVRTHVDTFGIEHYTELAAAALDVTMLMLKKPAVCTESNWHKTMVGMLTSAATAAAGKIEPQLYNLVPRLAIVFLDQEAQRKALQPAPPKKSSTVRGGGSSGSSLPSITAPLGVSAFKTSKTDRKTNEEYDQYIFEYFGGTPDSISSFEYKGEAGESVPVYLKKSGTGRDDDDLNKSVDGIYARFWNQKNCGEVIVKLTTLKRKFTIIILLTQEMVDLGSIRRTGGWLSTETVAFCARPNSGAGAAGGSSQTKSSYDLMVTQMFTSTFKDLFVNDVAQIGSNRSSFSKQFAAFVVTAIDVAWLIKDKSNIVFQTEAEKEFWKQLVGYDSEIKTVSQPLPKLKPRLAIVMTTEE